LNFSPVKGLRPSHQIFPKKLAFSCLSCCKLFLFRYYSHIFLLSHLCQKSPSCSAKFSHLFFNSRASELGRWAIYGLFSIFDLWGVTWLTGSRSFSTFLYLGRDQAATATSIGDLYKFGLHYQTQNQTFHYTCRITSNETSLRCPLPISTS